MQIPVSIFALLWLPVIFPLTTAAQPQRDTLPGVMTSTHIDSVVVSSTRPAVQWKGNNMVIAVSNNPLFTTAANTWDILKKIPGLDVTAEGGLLLSGRITPGVFINGKPTPMSTEELQQYLSGLTPAMIASIEIITNPSGKYEGEYKAIIDIRLKQDLSQGWKGNISTQLQRNMYTLADNNLNLSYKTHLWTFTARLGYTSGSRIRRYEALHHLANTNILSTHTETRTGNNNFSYALGAAYDVAKGHQLEVQWRAYLLNNNSESFNTLSTTNASGRQQVSHSNTRNQFTPRQDNYTASINYTTTLGKSQLVLLTNYSAITNKQREDIQTRNTLTNQLLSYWKTNLQNQIHLRSIQADWVVNAGSGKISAGTRYAHTTTRNALQYDTLNTNGVFANDSGRTNNFHYNEYITAAYLVYQHTAGKLSYTAGVRAEHTYSKANAITQNQVTNRNYTTWLPSLTLTYKINEVSQYNLAYTRRITRPGFAQLNPFRFYNSPLNYFVGNPLLLPSTTQTVTFTYNRKAFSASLHAGREKDPMSRYPEYNRVTNELEYLGRNLPYNDFAGLEVTLPVTLFPWWKTSHTLGGYYKKEQTPYHGVTYAIAIHNYTINANHVFTLPHGFTLDVYFKYYSRGGNGLYISKAQNSLDLGLQKTLFNGRLNMKLNYYDVLDAWRVYFIFREKQIIDNELQHWFGTRQLALSFNYSFGKATYKARQQTRTEEESRVGL